MGELYALHPTQHLVGQPGTAAKSNWPSRPSLRIPLSKVHHSVLRNAMPRDGLRGTQCTNSSVMRMRITHLQVMRQAFTDSSHIDFLLRPQRTFSFTLQLPEQLSSAIKPGPASLVDGIQCPLGDKVPLLLAVGSKTSTGNIKDGRLKGSP